VLHAFHKKSKTGIEKPKQEIDLTNARGVARHLVRQIK